MPRIAKIPKIFQGDIDRIQKYFDELTRNRQEVRNLAIISLLLKTGIKTHVLTSLNVLDFDSETRTIYPSHSKAPRKIKLDLQTNEILVNYLKYRRDSLRPLFIAFVRNPYNEAKELRLSDRSIQRIVKKFAKELKLMGNFTPKFFRHTLGIYYAAMRASSDTIDDILGSVAPWVTANYRRRAIISSEESK
jgi:integrase